MLSASLNKAFPSFFLPTLLIAFLKIGLELEDSHGLRSWIIVKTACYDVIELTQNSELGRTERFSVDVES